MTKQLLRLTIVLSLVSTPAFADDISLDRFTDPQHLFINNTVRTDLSSISSPDILGGSRTAMLTQTSPTGIFGNSVYFGDWRGTDRLYMEGLGGTLLVEWDGQGEGLDLDLSGMAGIAFERGYSDCCFGITIRLITSTGLFQLDTDSGFRDSYFPQSGFTTQTATHYFERFLAIGEPDWSDIQTIQFQMANPRPAGWVQDMRFVTPEPTTALLLMLAVPFALRRKRHA